MKFHHFTQSERFEIRILLNKKYSYRDIGKALGCSHASISREIRRNSSGGIYDPWQARVKSSQRRRYSKYQGMKIHTCSQLEEYVVEKLKEFWTPEEISGRIKNHDTHIPYVSAKGIYRWLYSAQGQKYCPYLAKQRWEPKKHRQKKTERHIIPNRVGIENRPEGANNRSEFGHFEADTAVSGKRHKSKAALSVLCERKARFTRLRKIPNLKPNTHNSALKQMASEIKVSTITYDNGIENRYHEKLAADLKIQTYFCQPYHSWEKGTVENTIGRIRRFIPKGANIDLYSPKKISKIEDWLNHTPRKCLNYSTPYEIMQKNLRFLHHPNGAFEG
jgi:transposase, IS30 family